MVVVVGATFVVVVVAGGVVVVVVVGGSVAVVVVLVVVVVGAAVTTSFAVATTVGGVKVSDGTVTVVMVTVVSWRLSPFTVWESLRVDATVEPFSKLSGEVTLSRGEDTETEVVALSVRGASVSEMVVKEESGAVGRSGFLGNSPRVSSESREQE